MHAPPSTAQNGITAARLGLALLVVVSHSFVLTGHLEPLVAETGQLSLGFAAVLGFFGLSGWLLAGSRLRTTPLPFLRNRALRIYPAYWIAILFTAAVAVAFGGTLEHALHFVGSNLTILGSGEGRIEPAFGGWAVNGSLWTLGVELACYIALAVTPIRWLRPVSVGLVATFLALWPFLTPFVTVLFLAFAVGAAVRIWNIPTTVRSCGVALVVAIGLYALHLTPLAGMALAYAALGLMHLPLRVERDLSYGVYVFAYPITLALGSLGASTAVAAIATIAIVLPLSLASWTWVERPAIGLRDLHLRRVAARQVAAFRTVAARA